jgi:outer membrane protein TolC
MDISRSFRAGLALPISGRQFSPAKFLSAGVRPAFTAPLLAAALLMSSFAHAQTSKPVPNAPAPKQAPLKPLLSYNPVPPGVAAPSSAAGDMLSGDKITFYTVVDLALRNSRAVHIAEAEQQRARGSWEKSRDVYIPSLSIGSGLGYSYGFPLGTPTLFNVTSQSLLFSFSQRDYIRSAKQGMKAATLSLKDARQKVILDASLGYIDLDKTLKQIGALRQATADSGKLIAIMQNRLHAGVGTDIQLTKAELTRAQIRLRTIQMENHADEIRRHLSHLTGLSPWLIDPAASSVPPLPGLDFSQLLDAGGKAPSVQAAVATANSKMYAAWGDKRQNYRPTVQFAFQYARFAGFNNYQQYYNARHFQFDNFGIGIQAIWPLFDPLRRDKAIESKAEATRARQQAELARIQTNEKNFTLWRTLRELKAEEQVATLQQRLAQDTLAATLTEMNSNSAPVHGSPVTPQQAQQNRIDERTGFVSLEDSKFNVTRAKLELLNAVGELENWAKTSAQEELPK